MDREQIRVLWGSMKLQLNEMQKRQYAATLAQAYGYGGATVVHEVTGVSMNTITAGKKELLSVSDLESGKVRKKGGGPKWLEEKYPDIQERVREIVDASTYGNPEKVLSWTTESLRSIQKTLAEKYNIDASYVTVGAILEDLGYSKQANQKMLQIGEPHPDRNAQFEFISKKAKEFIETANQLFQWTRIKKRKLGILKILVKNTVKVRILVKSLITIFRLKNLEKFHHMEFII